MSLSRKALNNLERCVDKQARDYTNNNPIN